jgi:hypothetical protein
MRRLHVLEAGKNNKLHDIYTRRLDGEIGLSVSKLLISTDCLKESTPGTRLGFGTRNLQIRKCQNVDVGLDQKSDAHMYNTISC